MSGKSARPPHRRRLWLQQGERGDLELGVSRLSHHLVVKNTGRCVDGGDHRRLDRGVDAFQEGPRRGLREPAGSSPAPPWGRSLGDPAGYRASPGPRPGVAARFAPTNSVVRRPAAASSPPGRITPPAAGAFRVIWRSRRGESAATRPTGRHRRASTRSWFPPPPRGPDASRASAPTA